MNPKRIPPALLAVLLVVCLVGGCQEHYTCMDCGIHWTYRTGLPGQEPVNCNRCGGLLSPPKSITRGTSQ